MALYKFFLIREGELVGEVKRQLTDDLDALDAARMLGRDYVVEVYEEVRLVARVKKGDASLTVSDSRSG